MIGTSTGEVYEDSVDHLLDTSNKRVSDAFTQFTPGQIDNFETKLKPEEESKFQDWKQTHAPQDSGFDYDLRGAYKAGLTPDPSSGHWPDTFKKPNHETFSEESIYAKDRPDLAGKWTGDNHDIYVPPNSKQQNPVINAPNKPVESGMGAEMAGSKAAAWTAWLASLPTSYAGAATKVTGAMSGVEAALTMYKMKTEIVDDVRKQVNAGTPVDKIKFEDGSAADGYGLFSSLQNHFKKPISEINSPQHATDDDAQRDSYNFFKALNDVTNPEAFKSAMSRWPLSTNIEDRRGEAPIASRTREDWGKGGLLPAMDSDRLKMGKPLMEIPSGAGGSYPAQNLRPIELDNAVTSWAQGKLQAREVQRIFKDKGWTLDLRRGRYDVEAFDPSGKAHYIQP